MILTRTTILVASCSVLFIGFAVAAPLSHTHDRSDAVSLRKKDSVRITGSDGTEDTPWTKRDDPGSVRITGGDSPNDTPWADRVKREDADSVRITGGDGTYGTAWHGAAT